MSIFAFVLFLTNCTDADTNKSPYSKKNEMDNITLEGKVLDIQSKPISQVVVTIISDSIHLNVNDIGAYTNQNGEFSFDNLEQGQYELKFVHDSFEVSRIIEIEGNNVINKKFIIE